MLDPTPKYRVYLEYMNSLTISQVAQQSGVNLQTVRYYEREGLITPAARTEAGYRIFQPETARRIRFIKRAQELGFSLNEIKELLSLRVDTHSTQADVRRRAQSKIDDVAQKIRHLEAIHASLVHLTKSCRGCGPLGECPILESLDHEEC